MRGLVAMFLLIAFGLAVEGGESTTGRIVVVFAATGIYLLAEFHPDRSRR